MQRSLPCHIRLLNPTTTPLVLPSSQCLLGLAIKQTQVLQHADHWPECLEEWDYGLEIPKGNKPPQKPQDWTPVYLLTASLTSSCASPERILQKQIYSSPLTSLPSPALYCQGNMIIPLHIRYHSLVVQRLKHLPAMWETWVQSLGWEDPLEEEIAIHSSILAWRIPRTEEVGGLQSTGRKESDMTERLHSLSIS